MAKKEKSSSIALNFYNVVLQPVKQQSPKRYAQLITKIYEDKISYNTFSDKYTQIRQLFNHDGLIYGKLVNFTYLKSGNWYNSATNEYEEVEFDPSLHPNSRDWDFFFSPNDHKLAVVSSASKTQIVKFFEYAFSQVVSKKNDESVQFSVISTSESIERFFTFKEITSVEIKVSYSNNDNNDGWEAAIDDNLKNSDTRQINIKATATQKNPLKIIKESVLGAFIQLAQRNGKVKATTYDGGTRRIVSTDDFPKQKTITYIDEQDLRDAICKDLKKV